MSSELSGAIAKRQAEPDTAPTMAAFGPPDQVRILQTIGLDPRDPRAHAVVAVAERYALDPVLGHLLILPKSNRPYITVDGYRHIALRSGQLDGIEVVDGPRRDPQEREWVCKVAVWRKDMSRAFIFPGRAEASRDNGPEMAIARAERRALKRAFAVTIPSEFADDEDDHRPPAVVMQPPDTSPDNSRVPPVDPPAAAQPDPIGPRQLQAVQAMFSDAGIKDRAERLAMLSDLTGRKITSAKNLTAAEATAILDGGGLVAADQQPADDTPPPGEPVDAEIIDDPDDPDDPAERQADDRPATQDQRKQVITAFKQAGVTSRPLVLAQLTEWTRRAINRTDELTEAEALDAINRAGQLPPPADDTSTEGDQ
jgi:hypothetical protein